MEAQRYPWTCERGEAGVVLNEAMYVDLAAAFVRGHRPDAPALAPEALVAWGREQGLRLHKFKRNAELPRVRKVLGMLRGLGPAALLDLGSGRGTFIWPLLDAFPWLPVTALDLSERRVLDFQAVARGGVARLQATQADAESLPFEDSSADVITALEVLEHVQNPERAARELVRVGRRFVVITVPSKPDDNPEHLRLFTAASLTQLMLSAGAKRVSIDGVHNHIVALATL